MLWLYLFIAELSLLPKLTSSSDEFLLLPMKANTSSGILILDSNQINILHFINVTC